MSDTKLEKARAEKELALLNHRLDGSNRCETCGHWRNDHALDLVGEHFCEHDGPDECKCKQYIGVMPPSYAELLSALRLVAGALAACAQETRYEAYAAICQLCEAKIPLDANGRHTGSGHIGSHCYATLIRAALERAATPTEHAREKGESE